MTLQIDYPTAEPNGTFPRLRRQNKQKVQQHSLLRGSYMSAKGLLNLSKELRKGDKMRGLLSILSLFCNRFNKFNNTGARMLDYIYHVTLKLLKIVKILPSYSQRYN